MKGAWRIQKKNTHYVVAQSVVRNVYGVPLPYDTREYPQPDTALDNAVVETTDMVSQVVAENVDILIDKTTLGL